MFGYVYYFITGAACIAAWIAVVKSAYDGNVKEKPNAAARYLAEHESSLNLILLAVFSVFVINTILTIAYLGP